MPCCWAALRTTKASMTSPSAAAACIIAQATGRRQGQPACGDVVPVGGQLTKQPADQRSGGVMQGRSAQIDVVRLPAPEESTTRPCTTASSETKTGQFGLRRGFNSHRLSPSHTVLNSSEGCPRVGCPPAVVLRWPTAQEASGPLPGSAVDNPHVGAQTNCGTRSSTSLT